MSKLITRDVGNGPAFMLAMSFPLNQEVLMDATGVLSRALAEDHTKGYNNGGPALASAVAKATEYANYVESHGSIQTLSEFKTTDYTFKISKPTSHSDKRAVPLTQPTQVVA